MLCLVSQFHADNYPIQFSIPGDKIVKKTPQKDLDFATIIPGDLKTYIYDNETDYYKGYQRAYYAVTTKKGGWDCLRHYEILANRCIPYFIGLENCPKNTLFNWPKKLIIATNEYAKSCIVPLEYDMLLEELYSYVKQNMTTSGLARYVIETSE
jgi:hypothetical protein